MSKPDTIKIDEVEYVRKDTQEGFKGDIKIVVLDRGFVYGDGYGYGYGYGDGN